MQMKTPMDRSEYRRVVRELLNRTRTALAACYAASPLEKPEEPEHRQEIAPNDIPSIRSQLDGAVKRLGDALLWHGIYRKIVLEAGATKAEEVANMLDSRVRNLRVRFQVAQDEVAAKLAQQVETRLDNAREAIVSAIDSHRPDSLIAVAFIIDMNKKVGELCAALSPVFRDIDDQLVQDLVAFHGSCYPMVARDVKEMADFLAQGVEDRLGGECGSALRGLWNGVQDNASFVLDSTCRGFCSVCLDADNNAWVPLLIVDYEGLFSLKKAVSEGLWKKNQPQVKKTIVKLLQEAWNAGHVAFLQQSLEQTERWVEQCKAAMGASPVKQQRQKDLESSLKEVEAAHAQGAKLLALLDRQPELGGDEAALHAFLRSCEGSFAAMGEAMVAFSSAVKESVVERLPVGKPCDQSAMNSLMRDLLMPAHLCGYVCTMPNLIEIVGTLLKKAYENVTEDEARKAVVLDWRGLGTAIFGLPEYARYRQAVEDAVESLLQCFGSLEFCSPAAISTEDAHTVDANSRKAWEEYWSGVAPNGVCNAPLNEVLQNVTTACDRALDDVWALERQRLEREFTRNPVTLYNYYYDPQKKS